jgi:cell division protein FtsI/penicillin-binding protein 2
MRVAGAAGHGDKNLVTACFAGYFPADHPRHVCIVVIEGADVILKYQRGALLAAPVFSFVAEKVQRLDLQ